MYEKSLQDASYRFTGKTVCKCDYFFRSEISRLLSSSGNKIVEPHDNGISTSIQIDLNPQDIPFRDVRSHPLCIDQTDVMRDAYFDTLSGMITSRLGCGA